MLMAFRKSSTVMALIQLTAMVSFFGLRLQLIPSSQNFIFKRKCIFLKAGEHCDFPPWGPWQCESKCSLSSGARALTDTVIYSCSCSALSRFSGLFLHPINPVRAHLLPSPSINQWHRNCWRTTSLSFSAACNLTHIFPELRLQL